MPRDAVLEAAGALRPAYQAVDWSSTPLGPVPSWSPALRNTIDLVLHTRFPVTLLWGPELVLVYNEAYVSLIAEKHPAALGARARDVFPEAWSVLGPLMEAVLAGGGATWIEDAPVPLRRRGFLEEAYFTFSYSPVRGADGAIKGVVGIFAETTRQVIDRRRLGLLSRLRELLGNVERLEELRERALPLLRANAHDLPIVDIEFADVSTAPAGAFASAGIDPARAGGSHPVARFPLGSRQQRTRRLVLVVRLSERLAPDEAYLGFLRLIASSLSQAVDRIDARQAERGVAAAERDMSVALQRSLLTKPLQPDHLDVAVRYLPAAEQAQVGGDWYDAFMAPDGALTVVVGDVAGHDRSSVPAMAQARNLLRGVSYATDGSPARVLSTLDQAMRGLAVGVYATAILGRVEQPAPQAQRGLRTLRWSNAGHPPPVLIDPDGRARLLETPPDPLLGVDGADRADHAVTLEPGASVLFYTDGLIERRGIGLQERLQWLTAALGGREGLSAEQLCDFVLAQLGEVVADDVALLVLRTYPEDEPRPAAAGPVVLPEDVRREAGEP